MPHRRGLAPCLVAVVAAITPWLASVESAQAATAPAACSRGYVALTFDDGPSTTTTQILSALHRAGGVRATFFNVGAHEQEQPALVSAEQAAGHRAGDHTYSHPFLDELSATDAYNEILGTQQIHQQITGVRERLFRPPYGRTTDEIRAAARGLGMTEVLWTVDTRDYAGVSVDEIVSAALTARGGDIILMHDAGYGTTVSALPRIIDGLASRGLCAGRIVPTTRPVEAWPGAVFYAKAARW